LRVLFINQVYHPDVAATAQHAHDLALHLVRSGHEVSVVASRSLYGHKGAVLPRRETVEGVEVHRVGRSFFGKAGILARVADFAYFYLAATMAALRIRRPDVVVCLTTPPFIALLGWLLRVVRRCRYVYWVMDLYPDLPVACGVMRPRSLVTRLFEAVNRFCLRRADRVVVLGRCMRQRVAEKGVDRGQIVRIGVWSDHDEVKPIPRSENPYLKQWNLGDRFVVMYSGNFGLGHDVDTMCRAAQQLNADDRITFVFVGGGKKKTIVDEFVKSHDLGNVVLAPYQPREALDGSLSCADVHLASLLESVEGVMVPSKLFGIMAAERPTIFIGPPGSELARVLLEYDCGVVVRPGDVTGLVKTIREMVEDPHRVESMGQNARRALIAAFDRGTACATWQRLLEDVTGADAPPREAERPTGKPAGDLRC